MVEKMSSRLKRVSYFTDYNKNYLNISRAMRDIEIVLRRFVTYRSTSNFDLMFFLQ